MVIVAASLVLVAFPTVVFGGETFMTGWKAPGVNAFEPPYPGFDVPVDGIRADAGASAWQFDPWVEVTSRSLDEGAVPLWNPHQGMGTPHAAAFQTAVFDPLLSLVNLHPTPLTWDFSFLLAFALGSAAMYLFLRQLGLGRLASLVGAATFVWSGFFMRYSNNHFFRAYLYLPALFLLAQLTIRKRGPLAPIGLGLGVAGVLLIGMPEPFIFVLGALTLYCLYLMAFPPVAIGRLVALRRFVLAAMLGSALAAPLLLPGLEFLRLSFSTHEADAVLGKMADPPGQILRWLMPYALGEKDGPFAATRHWVGTASLVAVAGAVASRRTIARTGGWFFFALGALVMAKTYGFVLVQWAGALPPLNRLIIPVYAVPVIGFCAAVLAAIGVQAVAEQDIALRRVGVALAVLTAGVTALLVADRNLMAALPDGHLIRHLGLAGAAGAAVAGALYLNRTRGQIIVGLAILLELGALVPRGLQVARVDAFVRPTWLEYVVAQTRETQARVYGLDAKLFPNTASAFGLQDIRSLNALYPERYVAYVKRFIQPGFVDRFIGGPPFGSETTRGETDNNPMFDLTGVRYIVTGGQEPGDALVRSVLTSRPQTDDIFTAALDVSGDTRSALFVKAGTRASLPVPPGATKLAFAASLDPKRMAPEAKGVVGSLRLTAGSTTALWSKTFIPSATVDVPPWTEVVVDLPAGTATLELGVDPVPNSAPEGLGFADLRFGSGPESPPVQYRKVMAGDQASVYENRMSLPRAFVVHRATAVPDEQAATVYLDSVSEPLPSGARRVTRFDPATEAVVEGPTDVADRLAGCAEPGRAKIQRYETSRVEIDVESRCSGLVVLSDLFYPGWKARVNGTATPMYATDLAFRGVPVTAGRSTVVISYEPNTFRLGLIVALLGVTGACIALLMSIVRGRSLRLRRR